MRATIGFCGLLLVVSGVSAAEPQHMTSLTDSSSKVRVGPLLEETATEITIHDLKEDVDFQAAKASLKKIEKKISDDAAIRIAGLAPIVAHRVSEFVVQTFPPGKIAQVSQNVVYTNLGADSGAYVGQKLDIFRKLAEIRDPETNEVLGVERPKMGVLELTEIQKNFSKGRVVSDVEVALKAGDEVEPEGGGASRVAVLPIRTENGEQFDVGQNLAEELVTKLVQQKVTVLERSLLDRVVAEQAWQNTILFEPDKVQRLGQLMGATAVVTGKIVVRGKLGTAFLRLIDVRTGKIQYATSGSISLLNAKIVSSSAGRDDSPSAPMVRSGKTSLGKGSMLPAGWTTKARFANSKDGGLRLSGKTDLVVTRDGGYLKQDFALEVVVTITDNDHITLIGLGDVSVVNPYGDPKLAAMLRIHAPHLNSGVLLTKNNATTDNLGMISRPGTHMVRITKEGSAVTFAVDVDNDGPTPDDMEVIIADINEYAPFLHTKNTFLFFGGTGQFKSVNLK